MKKSTIILVALALFACTLAASATDSEGCSGKALDKAKECGCEDGQHGGIQAVCSEICKDDKCGMHAASINKCQEPSCLQCIVKEMCDNCGKTFYCDGICDECGEPCTVYEYCPSCGAKYITGLADARCNVCGKDCLCFEKCENCGHSHYFNGFCDECASKCKYLRCCINLCGMQDHESSCGCQEHTHNCNEAPKKCDCEKNMQGHAESGLDGQFEHPAAVGDNLAQQGEMGFAVPMQTIVISAN